MLFDLNLDGLPDVVGGACQTSAVGDRTEFESCGDDGVCAEGLSCLTLPGRPTGTCFAQCESTCAPFGVFEPRCSATTTESRVCLIECAGVAGCPEGAQCVVHARGNLTCVR